MKTKLRNYKVDWQDYGDRVLIARRHKGLSQTELGKAIGVSRVTISSIECGDTDPNYALIGALSFYLGIDFPLVIPKEGQP
jgi:transcriptional regulator with XRE-family HTH domain